MSQKWNTEQEKGNFFVLHLTLWLYRHAGRSVFMLILNVVIFWYWLCSRKARTASLDYLRRVHQVAGKQSPFKQQPTLWNSYQHLRQFGISILDKIHAWSGGTTEQDLSLFGHEYIRQYYGQGAIIMVSHFGNIELLRAIKSDHHQVVNVLVYTRHAEKFNAFLQEINPKAGVRLISVAELGIETAMLLQQRLDAGEWIVIASDRVPVASSRQQGIKFLGKIANFPEGAWWLAHLLQAPVVAVFCYPYQQQYQLYIYPLSENLQLPRQGRQQVLAQHMTHYVQLLEQHCLHAPYQWFNFFDFWANAPQDNTDVRRR